jgi:hypothetical protein
VERGGGLTTTSGWVMGALVCLIGDPKVGLGSGCLWATTTGRKKGFVVGGLG